MPKYMFEKSDGEKVEVDSPDVVELSDGRDDQETILGTKDGDEFTVPVARQEVAIHLDLDTLLLLSDEYFQGEKLEDFHDEASDPQ